MSTQKALICIPDLTGFTNFINSVEIQYTQKIMPAIIRSLVSANILDFEVAEIQGDAVLFYKVGEPPSLEEIVKQCNKLYKAFKENLDVLHRVYGGYLNEFDLKENLGLKIVIHYGEVGMATVVGNTKLYGQDVIKSLELLKNSIEYKEYVLFSEDYLNASKVGSNGYKIEAMENGEDNYEKLGRITYKFLPCEYFNKAGIE